jgi:hypothetical protein
MEEVAISEFGEGTVECFMLFRMTSKVLPNRLAKNMVCCRLACHDAVTESSGRFQEVVGAIEKCAISKAARAIAEEIGCRIVGP